MEDNNFTKVMKYLLGLRPDWWPPTWLVILVVLVLGLYLLITWRYDYFTKRDIPFIKPLPFLGNFGPFIFKQRSFGDTLADIYQSFDGRALGGYFLFLTPILMIRDPEIIKQIGVKDFEHFTDHITAIREDSDPIFGKNMFMLQGQRWRDMRHTLSPAYTSSKMKAMFHLVAEIGKQLITHLRDQCKREKNGMVTLEMKNFFTRFTSDVIATTAFGVQCNSLDNPDNEFFKVGADLTNFGGKNGLVMAGNLFSPGLMKFLKITFVSLYNGNFFRHLVHSTMEQREKQGIVRPDMIHLLMQARKGTLKSEATDEAIEGQEDLKGKKSELSDDDITAQAVFFFLAGFETTSTLLCFLSHQMAIHPDIQKRVQDEVDETMKQDGGKLTYDGIQRMKYLEMVISETLRLFPPLAFMDRVCVKSYVIPASATSPSVYIKEGDWIAFPTIGMHRDPKFFPDPLKFDPERFSEEGKQKILPYTYTPFGLGPRGCIGMRFALMTTKVAIASLLSKFEIHVVAKTRIPVKLQKMTFFLGAEGGFWLGLKPRTLSPA